MTARTKLLVAASLVLTQLVLPLKVFASAGALDTSFDGDGKVTTDFGGLDEALGVAIQPNGKIVAAGTNGGDFAVARYNRDGTLDTSLDGDGKVTTDFGSPFDLALGVAVQPDGTIVAAGTNGGDFAVARYDRDGSLDTSFDGDGKVTTDFGALDAALGAPAIQPNGRIVAAGYTSASGDFALARYNRDGSLDASFDGDGKVTTDFGSPFDQAEGVAIQPDGRIVAAGFNSAIGDFALARYNGDGALDASFDGDGKVMTDFGGFEQAFGVAIQPDGGIVAAGGGGMGIDFALARYNRDGTLDTSFDGDGKVTTDFGSSDAALGVAVRPEGRIVAAGTNGGDFAVARYDRDGSLDTSFDGDGKVTTDFGGDDRAAGVAIQSNGRIVAAGNTFPDGDFALARYLPR